MTRTSRDYLLVCPECSTTEEDFGVITPSEMADNGYVLEDGAWVGQCERCRDAATDKSNAEYEALARAAAELGRIQHVGPLGAITIPDGEGFGRAGVKVFGFWAVATGTGHFETLVLATIDNINRNRDLGLVVNINGDYNQAIIHGGRA